MDDFARAVYRIRQMLSYGAPLGRVVETVVAEHGVSPSTVWLFLKATELADRDKPWWESGYE